MTMATSTPADVARSIFDALSKKDLDGAMVYVTDDTVDDFVAIGRFAGKSAIRGFFEELLAAYPTFEMTVDRIVGNDSTAVVQWHASGAFTGGPFQGIEPTGRHVEMRGVDVMEITGGKVKYDTIYYDGASLARQIGMLPKPGSGAERVLQSAFNSATKLRRRVKT